MVAPIGAHAVCSSPSGNEGKIIFNTTTKTMQYCNNTNWVNLGTSVPAASNNGCSSPAGLPGSVIYNNSLGIVQFCNGDDWVATACAETRTLGGTGCSNPTGREGQIIYETSSKELQFCDSTDWVAMGWPCTIGATATVPDVATMFSNTLFTGNGGTLPVVTGLNMSGKGGVTFIKSTGGYGMVIFDTVRGFGNYLTFANYAQNYAGNLGWSAGTFNTNGFTTVSGTNPSINANTLDFDSWSFRKASKFFDIIGYTGNGVAGRTINHALGTSPGMVFVKKYSNTGDWQIWHSAFPTKVYASGTAEASDGTGNGSTASEVFSENNITASTIGLGGASSPINVNGESYVAYVFAHYPTGNISCGTYTGNGTTTSVTLGWEPQFIFNKRTDYSQMLASPAHGTFSGTEYHMPMEIITPESAEDIYTTNSTGFTATGSNYNINGIKYIYCAIRKTGTY